MTGKSQLEWKKIQTKGKMPCARYCHSMNFSDEQNILVIFGGRCDLSNKKSNN